ncbi:MAG: cytidine deaminase [Tannerellaceae bacterium]
MKEIVLNTKIKVCALAEQTESHQRLTAAAVEAASRAYAPYSKFNVGAAVLLGNGEIVTGNNQENAAYPSGLCAERVALFYAGSRYPDVPIVALAIAAFTAGRQVEQISPCGACRQVLLESEMRAASPITILLCGSSEVYILPSAASLLPFCFDGSELTPPFH